MKYEVIPMTMTALLHCSTRVSSNKGRVSPSESPMVSSGRVDWSVLSNFEELSKSCRVSGSWLVEAAALFKRPPESCKAEAVCWSMSKRTKLRGQTTTRPLYHERPAGDPGQESHPHHTCDVDRPVRRIRDPGLSPVRV